jgi:hypothetical protein
VAGTQTATCAVSTATTGANGSLTLKAKYNAGSDPNYSNGNATNVTYVVNKATPTVGLAVSPPGGGNAGGSTYGQTITLVANVEGVTGGAPPAGTVDFTTTQPVSNTPICTGVTLSPLGSSDPLAATATCNTSALAAGGSPNLKATYNPISGGNYTSGNGSSTIADYPITKAASSTTLVAAPATSPGSTYGMSVQLTATVTGASGAPVAPTGSVAFTASGISIESTCDSVTLVADPGPPNPPTATAICTTTLIPGGTWDLKAKYNPDSAANYSGSSSATLHDYPVALATPTVVLMPTPAGGGGSGGSTHGDSVVLTASVTGVGGGVAPTGTVEFTAGGTDIGDCTNPATISAGVATCTTSSLGAGAQDLAAVYGGDTNYSSGSDSVDDYPVAKATPTVDLTVDAPYGQGDLPSPTYGTSITIRAVVNPVGATPTGHIDFTSDGVSIDGCDAVELASGVATCPTSLLTGGGHDLAAVYDGDDNYTGSTGTQPGYLVTPGAQTFDLETNHPGGATYGDDVVVTLTVTGCDGCATPSGEVSFTGTGGVSPCLNVTLVAVPMSSPPAASASCDEGLLDAGSYDFSADYLADSNYEGGTPNLTSYGVAPVTPTVQLQAAPDASTLGESVTLTATVNAVDSGATPLGGVIFTSDGIGISDCANPVTLTSGTAQCVTTSLAVGTHDLEAAYGGDPDYTIASGGIPAYVVTTVPDAPGLTSATAGGESIDLVWTAPTDDGGSAIIEYQLFCAVGTSTPDTSGVPNLTVDPTATTATVDGLTGGTEYTCVVVAVNEVGQSDPSNIESATPFTVPSAPSLTSATGGDTSIALVWTASTDDGGSAITEYDLYCAAGTSAPDTNGPPDQTAGPTDTTGNVTGLTNGTEYTCVVIASNAAGPSDASNIESATPFTVPDAPSLTSTTAGDESIALVWTAPADDGGSPITAYNLYCAEGSLSPSTTGTPTQTVGDSVTSSSVTGLTNGTLYTCVVTAVNVAGQSAASDALSKIPFTVPDAPGLTSATAGSGSIALVWTAPVDDGGSAITGYNLFCAPGILAPSTSGTPTGTAGAGDTSKTVSGLTGGTEYTCVVTAVNAAGQSAASGALSATPTVPSNPPPPPTGGPVVTVDVASSTANPSVFGQPVTFTADVTGAGAGQVQWSIDGVPTGAPETPSTSHRAAHAAGDPVVTLGPTSSLSVGSHVVKATFTPAGGGSATSASVTQVVNKAATSTAVTVTGTTLTATVTPVAPGAGTPTGTVTFSVAGAGAGSAPVGADGKATVTDASVGSQVVTATYAGDTNFNGSSGTGSSVTNPTITAHLSSAHAKHHGWYRSSVHVSFTCTLGSAPLSAPCPGPVTVSGNGSGHSVTRTVHATDGGVATVVVSKINIDKTAPTVHVKGVTSGKTYTTAPHLKCVAHDALSGVASCVIHRHRHKQNGVLTVHYTATAIDVAGNENVVHGLYRVS